MINSLKRVSSSPTQSEVNMVKQTGAKIQNAVERYMSENKLSTGSKVTNGILI
jgi:hypothetical protein